MPMSVRKSIVDRLALRRSRPDGRVGGASDVRPCFEPCEPRLLLSAWWITTLDEGGCDEPDSYDYVVITSDEIANEEEGDSNVENLITHRENAAGGSLSATTVTVENILALDVYDGVDDAESIRNFIVTLH